MTTPLGTDPGWLAALAAARGAALWPRPVVIRGETGTGKELVAEEYHAATGRKGPIIKVNCGAIPANVVEYALFGYAKGAYTGAHEASLGHFRAAQGGTIFLDEIGELPLDAQVKLLRVLQDSVVMPVGTSASVPIDVRVICATHRDLEAMVKAGTFREDLWYRLRTVRIEIPPLRERKLEDIITLARESLERNRLGFSPTDFSPAALAALRAHPWPGNVRELESVVCSALVVHGARPGSISAEDLGLENKSRPGVICSVPIDFDALEREHKSARAACKALGWAWTTYRRRAAAAHPRPTRGPSS